LGVGKVWKMVDGATLNLFMVLIASDAKGSARRQKTTRLLQGCNGETIISRVTEGRERTRGTPAPRERQYTPYAVASSTYRAYMPQAG
jgi:hypothetical protein